MCVQVGQPGPVWVKMQLQTGLWVGAVLFGGWAGRESGGFAGHAQSYFCGGQQVWWDQSQFEVASALRGESGEGRVTVGIQGVGQCPLLLLPFPRLAGDATPQGRTPPRPPTHPACSMALGCPSAFWARHSLHTHSLIGAFLWL